MQVKILGIRDGCSLGLAASAAAWRPQLRGQSSSLEPGVLTNAPAPNAHGGVWGLKFHGFQGPVGAVNRAFSLVFFSSLPSKNL